MDACFASRGLWKVQTRPLCVACCVLLYVPANDPAAEVLCPACHKLGEELAEAEDNDPPPPPPSYSAGLVLYSDDDLIAAVAKVDAARVDDGWVGVDVEDPQERGAADASKPGWILKSRADKEQFLDAATSELLRRMDGRQRLAA